MAKDFKNLSNPITLVPIPEFLVLEQSKKVFFGGSL